MKDVFVTGTDTGVGKTLVCAALLARGRAQGGDVVPMKPVQTGCVRHGRRLSAPDLECCLRMAGMAADAREYPWMAPYCFRLPASPHLAAAHAGRRIRLDRIVAAYRALRHRHDGVIVEGAGGVLAPINARHTLLDVMRALALPVVVVARPGLGTINHTLLTLRALRAAGVRVAGVVFNAAQPTRPGLIERDNVATIARLGGVRCLGWIPFLPRWRTGRLSPEAFRKQAARWDFQAHV